MSDSKPTSVMIDLGIEHILCVEKQVIVEEPSLIRDWIALEFVEDAQIECLTNFQNQWFRRSCIKKKKTIIIIAIVLNIVLKCKEYVLKSW